MFAGKKSAQIREILISESAWEEMTCLFAPSLALGCIRKYPQHIKTVHYSIDSKHYENISQLESQLRLIQDNLDKQVDNCAQSPYIDLYRTMSDNAQQNGKIYLSDGLWLDKDGNISD